MPFWEICKRREEKSEIGYLFVEGKMPVHISHENVKRSLYIIKIKKIRIHKIIKPYVVDFVLAYKLNRFNITECYKKINLLSPLPPSPPPLSDALKYTPISRPPQPKDEARREGERTTNSSEIRQC
jgi:hypothetical protein